jgi:AmiR/NasT family two-component response regulator
VAEALFETQGSAARLEAELDHLRIENEQLRHALSSRIVIEQAKGILAERHGLSIDAAFFVLRGGARSSQARLHELAREVVESGTTPPCIVHALARIAA